ncbi:1-acyl-sn-glycerol-3-phosphate acyltransferase [Granulibacter bethesdensis]|uniref:lysophospholipid acyltransferase family protein n=1 Tax=Granulibacter bethesdensis TaxID=364410 RepID=UPI000909FA4A|nr:lysophospholipid acyltransferase family protein [Granulibacter bethesdensis]APH55913.1 1-acyl-sn-glycerol-3-phosphate acyltransferase [Granulibacter bethesdensis]
MIFLRSLLFNAVFFAVTLVLSLYGFVLRFVAPHRLIDDARLWSRIMIAAARLICGIHVRVRGLENLPPGQPVLIASQHQSAFDTMVWFGLASYPVYVLKKQLLKIPVFGPLLPLTGMIPVDRDGGMASLRNLVSASLEAASLNRQIVIFPEGTRTDPGVEVPLHPGIYAVASKTGLPIVPVTTNSGLFWGRRAFRKYPGTINVDIHPPLSPGSRAVTMEALRSLYHRAGNDIATFVHTSERAVDKSVV